MFETMFLYKREPQMPNTVDFQLYSRRVPLRNDEHFFLNFKLNILVIQCHSHDQSHLSIPLRHEDGKNYSPQNTVFSALQMYAGRKPGGPSIWFA